MKMLKLCDIILFGNWSECEPFTHAIFFTNIFLYILFIYIYVGVEGVTYRVEGEEHKAKCVLLLFGWVLLGFEVTQWLRKAFYFNVMTNNESVCGDCSMAREWCVRDRESNMKNMKTKAWNLEKSLKMFFLLHAQLPRVEFVLVVILNVAS